MEPDIVFGDLEIQGKIFGVPLFPVHPETEPANIKLPGLFYVENPQQGYDRMLFLHQITIYQSDFARAPADNSASSPAINL